MERDVKYLHFSELFEKMFTISNNMPKMHSERTICNPWNCSTQSRIIGAVRGAHSQL